MSTLDVLITVSDSTPRTYVTQCRNSVAVAAARAGYPVNVIEVPGVPGHIGRAMANGFAMTSAPYVSWVDDDDMVLPNAFSCLQRHFEANPAAIFARELRVYPNGAMIPTMGPHHLSVWRRDILETVDYTNDPARPYMHLYHEVQEHTVAHEESWVYLYRVRKSDAFKLRAKHPVKLK